MIDVQEIVESFDVILPDAACNLMVLTGKPGYAEVVEQKICRCPTQIPRR